ncbi:MAG: hypothetical protein ED559_02695 [Phycisphaera sp.]|nr:MAG: hypothetical protein ED559_02695 [Phycisphaera sp.]
MTKILSIVLGVLVLAAVAGSIFVFSMKPSTNRDSVHPLDTVQLWICLAEEEPHDFSLTVRELAALSDVGVKCPTCGASEDLSRALECPECGRHYPAGRYNASPTHCLHCNAELPGAEINIFHGHEGH